MGIFAVLAMIVPLTLYVGALAALIVTVRAILRMEATLAHIGRNIEAIATIDVDRNRRDMAAAEAARHKNAT